MRRGKKPVKDNSDPCEDCSNCRKCQDFKVIIAQCRKRVKVTFGLRGDYCNTIIHLMLLKTAWARIANFFFKATKITSYKIHRISLVNFLWTYEQIYFYCD